MNNKLIATSNPNRSTLLALVASPLVAAVAAWLIWKFETALIGDSPMAGGMLHALYQTRWFMSGGVAAMAWLATWTTIKDTQAKWPRVVILFAAMAMPVLQVAFGALIDA